MGEVGPVNSGEERNQNRTLGGSVLQTTLSKTQTMILSPGLFSKQTSGLKMMLKHHYNISELNVAQLQHEQVKKRSSTRSPEPEDS